MSRLSTSQQQQYSTNNSNNTIFLRVLSAIFYAICSITVIFVNKILLTNYRFPSFLYVAFGQMLTTVVILYLLKRLKFLSFPKMDVSIPEKIFPLPIFFAVNLIAGLGGTKIISLPMFTVLRRFSIFLTMLFEYFILGIIPTFGVKFSVFLMILGSAIAAMFDLSFDSLGYLLICFNNFATALNGVYMKKKLNSKELGKNGLLFYNSLFMLLPLIGFILLNNEETEKLRIYIDQGYLTIPVLLFLLLSCIGGLLLNYSVVLCTSHNSALTTVCVGPIKNMFVTYIGMISSGDYIFTWNNFIGINISVFGSILYTYVTFRTNERIISRTDIASIKIKEGERETLL